jgi:hypothetical protein
VLPPWIHLHLVAIARPEGDPPEVGETFGRDWRRTALSEYGGEYGNLSLCSRPSSPNI